MKKNQDDTPLNQIIPLQENALESYINKHVLNSKPVYIYSSKRRVAKGIMMFIGSTFGLPWINSAMNFANHFPDGIGRRILSYYFGAGAVLGLGGEQIWMMSTIGNMLLLEADTVKSVYISVEGSRTSRYLKIIIPSVCGTLASVPWVYASIIFNPGIIGWLSALTVFPNNFAFGFVGYHVLINRFLNVINYYRLAHEQRKVEDTRGVLIESIKHVIYNNIEIPNEITTPKMLIEYLLTFELEKQNRCPTLRTSFQIILTSVIPLLYLSTEGLLSKKFLYENIWESEAFAYSGASIIIIPGLVMSAISTFDLSRQLFDTLICEANVGSIQSILYPVLSWVITFIILVTAFSAPTAGAEIANETINQETGDSTIAWACTVGMLLFHFILFKFTSRELTTELMVLKKSSTPTIELPSETQSLILENQIQKSERIANQYNRLTHFSNVLEKADPVFLNDAVLWRKTKSKILLDAQPEHSMQSFSKSQ